MYSVVLMVAATSGGDMAAFGNKGSGCTGCTGYVASCSGGGFLGLKDKMGGHGCCGGGGFLGHKDKGGCHGSSCHGGELSCHGGCTGTVVHSAPMVVESASCHGCSGYSCHGSSCHGSSCHGGGFLGLRDKMGGGGLFGGKHKGGCCGGCW
jgi:hypothetical protein